MEHTAASSYSIAAKPRPSTSDLQTSTWQLVKFFGCWKALLLLLALASPGPGYDTSTQIFLQNDDKSRAPWLDLLALKLTRWDAIYFVSSSARGYVFEQEWAFSRSFASLTSIIAAVLPSSMRESPIAAHAAAGIFLSHVAHLAAVLILYQITLELIPSSGDGKRHRVAFIAGCLHVLSPAGLFLSASYSESFFAALNLGGMLCYIWVRHHSSRQDDLRHTTAAAGLSILSGILFALASLIRSNGLLSGTLFAWEALNHLFSFPTVLQKRKWSALLQIAGTLLGGAILALGYILPQAEAYLEYCTGESRRPWCDKLIPSIYTFVQAHYWNVGLLRYWTLSNIPLFLLAAPMMLVLLGSAGLVLSPTYFHGALASTSGGRQQENRYDAERWEFCRSTMTRLALPQAVLAILALTSFHVQIVNRISSGYPIWYIVLAIYVESAPAATQQHTGKSSTWLSGIAQVAARASMMYAIIQGGLYASFMPPA